jgi:hypothetical protein
VCWILRLDDYGMPRWMDYLMDAAMELAMKNLGRFKCAASLRAKAPLR